MISFIAIFKLSSYKNASEKILKVFGGHCKETFCCKWSQPKEPTPGDEDDGGDDNGEGGNDGDVDDGDDDDDDVDQFAGERVEDRVELGLVFIGDPPLGE